MNHFMLYSEALWLLLQTAPSSNDIDRAECLIDTFCFEFASLYDGKIIVIKNYTRLHANTDNMYMSCTINYNIQVKDTTRPTCTSFDTLLNLSGT